MGNYLKDTNYQLTQHEIKNLEYYLLKELNL